MSPTSHQYSFTQSPAFPKGGKDCPIEKVFGLGNKQQTAAGQRCYLAVFKSPNLSLRFCQIRFNQQDSIVKGRNRKTG